MTIARFSTRPIRSQMTDQQYVDAVETFFDELNDRIDQMNAVAALLDNQGGLYAMGNVGGCLMELTIGEQDIAVTVTAMRGWYGGGAYIWSARSDKTKQMLVICDTYDPVTGAFTGTVPAGQTAGTGTFDDWIIGPAPGATTVGKQAFYAAVRGWVPRLTNGPEVSAFESATYKVNSRTHNFDASTIEYDQLDLGTGASWDAGTITGRPIWSHPATTVNFKVSWGLQGLALSDGDLLDTAFGVAQFSNDVGGTTDKVYIGPETAPITLGNAPAEGDWLMLQCLRKADDAVNDTLAVDARLHGWILYLTTDKPTDA